MRFTPCNSSPRFKPSGPNKRRGATAVEMAVVIGLLMLMLIGLMQFAWLLFSLHAMQTASDRGARALAVQEFNASESSDRTATELSAMFGGNASAIAINVSQTGVDRTIEVETPASNAWISFGDVFGLLQNITTVGSKTTMRYEGSY